MKKIVMLMVILSVLLNLCACANTEGGTTVTNPTAAPETMQTEPNVTEETAEATEASEVPTETTPEEEEVYTPVDPEETVIENETAERTVYNTVLNRDKMNYVEDSLKEDSTVVSNISFDKCNEILQDLGYEEVWVSNFSGYRLKTLTYNDQVFKLTFSALSMMEGGVPSQNYDAHWTLWGTKAEKIENISTFEVQNYLYSDIGTQFFRNWYNPAASLYNVPECPQYDGCFAFNWDGSSPKPSDCATYMAVYYPISGNLYNFTITTQNDLDINPPYILMDWEDYMLKIWREDDNVWDAKIEELENTIFFEEGMTWMDWSRSKYNMDGWVLEQDPNGKILRSADGLYVIPAEMYLNGQLVTMDMMFPKPASDDEFRSYSGFVFTSEQWAQKSKD